MVKILSDEVLEVLRNIRKSAFPRRKKIGYMKKIKIIR